MLTVLITSKHILINLMCLDILDLLNENMNHATSFQLKLLFSSCFDERFGFICFFKGTSIFQLKDRKLPFHILKKKKSALIFSRPNGIKIKVNFT